MPFDEINALKQRLQDAKQADTAAFERSKGKYIDEVTDLLLMAYFYGQTDVMDQLGATLPMSERRVRAVLEQPVAGKTYKERLSEYIEQGNLGDIDRVIETETHRVYNQAAFEAAREAGATMKTWNCMMLPTSRDSHVYLNDVTIPMDAAFYSINGGTTMFPGQWGIAEEDVNCLCTLTFSKS